MSDVTERCVDCGDSLDGEGICQMCAIIRESKAEASLHALRKALEAMVDMHSADCSACEWAAALLQGAEARGRVIHADDCALEIWGRECPDEGPPSCTCAPGHVIRANTK